MLSIEHLTGSGQPDPESEIEPAAGLSQNYEDEGRTIGELLRSLRGKKSLRQVERDTGTANSYLSRLEMGTKRPGARTLGRLAVYYGVPMQELFHAAGLQVKDTPSMYETSDVRRGYEYVTADPRFAQFKKPTSMPTEDTQRFIVQMYQCCTGKKLL